MTTAAENAIQSPLRSLAAQPTTDRPTSRARRAPLLANSVWSHWSRQFGATQSNGMFESFVKTFKRDYVRRMDRRDVRTVLTQLQAAFTHYNEVHPRRALKMLSPRMFRQKQSQLSNAPCPE